MLLPSVEDNSVIDKMNKQVLESVTEIENFAEPLKGKSVRFADIDVKELSEANADERSSTRVEDSIAHLSSSIEGDEVKEDIVSTGRRNNLISSAIPETIAHDVSGYQVRDMSFCFELQAALSQLPCIESIHLMQLRIGINRAVAQLPVIVPSGNRIPACELEKEEQENEEAVEKSIKDSPYSEDCLGGAIKKLKVQSKTKKKVNLFIQMI